MPIIVGKKPILQVQPKMVVVEQHTKDKGKTLLSDHMTEVPVGDKVMVGQNTPMTGIKFGRVWSDGNFGSFRVEVSLDLPVGVFVDMDLVGNTLAVAQMFVDEKMKELLKGTPVGEQ